LKRHTHHDIPHPTLAAGKAPYHSLRLLTPASGRATRLLPFRDILRSISLPSLRLRALLRFMFYYFFIFSS